MAPKKRADNKHLPARVYLKHGAYYFVDMNQKWHRLGKSLPEAMEAWTDMIERPLSTRTMHGVFERYLTEVSTTKAATTYKQDVYGIKSLKTFFGDMYPEDITPVDIYKYMDIRKQVTVVGANKEKSLLSHILTMAIRWGVLTDNVCKNVQRLTEKKRDRYIEEWEFEVVYNSAPDLIKAAMMIAYLTGLRLGDLLKIKLSDLNDQGIKIQISKTKNAILIEWTDALREAVNLAKKLNRPVRGMHLFCTRKGQPYSADGFKSIWQRVMNSAMKKELIKERFRFHDIRRKAASDIEAKDGRELARKLLGHSTQKMTENYIAGVQKVRPVK